MTALDWDTAVDMSVDLTRDVPCVYEECDQPATLRETNLCACRLTAHLCTEHAKTDHEFHEANCAELGCVRCQGSLPHPHVHWSEL